MLDHAGTTALVTGASSGIGAAFAAALSARGADVVLVARRADRLEELAARLRREHGRTATVLAADLAAPGGTRALVERVEEAGLRVDTLVNNAGFATHGRLVDEKSERIQEEIALNVAALVDLTHAYLPGMVARGRGVIVNVASTAAFQPVPSMAVYGATKAFVLSFTEAVAHENRATGVRVLALCPGATRTEFFEVAGDAAAVGRPQTPDEVVRTALQALDARRTPASVVSGLSNRIGALLPRVVPRRTALTITGRLVETRP